MILVSHHKPDRPAWTCRRCGLPYPCAEARRWLAAAHQHRGELGTVAYELLEEAVRDLPADVPLADLWDRFVAWTEPTPSRGV